MVGPAERSSNAPLYTKFQFDLRRNPLVQIFNAILTKHQLCEVDFDTNNIRWFRYLRSGVLFVKQCLSSSEQIFLKIFLILNTSFCEMLAYLFPFLKSASN